MKNTKTIFLFQTFLIITTFIFCTQQMAMSTTVSTGHPRIWLNPGSKTQLITDCSPDGSLRDYYLRVKEYVDSRGESTGNNFAYHRYWFSVLLCAMVDGGSYLNEVKSKIANEWGNPPSSRYSESHQAAIALAYDWLFDDLATSEKQAIADHFVDWWNYHTSTSAYFHSSWNNHTMEEIQGFTFGILALYGDGFCDSEAAANLPVANHWLYDEIITATNLEASSGSDRGSDGGWAEGFYYWGRGTFALIESLYAWSSATDENALEDSIAMKNLGKWLFFISRNDNTYARFSDGYQSTLTLTGQPDGSVILYMLSDLYQDGYARYMWNQRVPDNGILSPTALSSGYSYLYLFYILFHNNTSAINITSQPTNIYFDGLDMVVIRNSFSEGDTFFCYKNNDWTAGHDHFDAGHFEIARDRGLAIDTGAYEGGDSSPNHHDTKYYRRTIAHNTITVYDPNEIWDDYYGRYTTNDGGQKWPGPANGSGHPQRVADLADDSYDRGGIQKFKSTDEYTYFLADLTPAYSRADGSDIAITHSSKMEKFTREILHLDKKYFIVFDKVKSSDVNFTKRWLLHFVNQPTVSGNLITAHNGNSVLYNSTVFPQNHQITVRGGSGQEYWTNYDATGENPTFNTGYFGKFPNEPGSWRAEIEPQNHNQTDYFLNVLAPGPDTLSPPITKAITENNNKMIGVQISGNPGYVILFNTDITGDDVSGTISYTTDTGSENAHYLFGLPAGTRYNADIVNSGETTTVTISPDPNGSYQTTADNLLELPLNSSHMPIIQTVTIE